VPKKIFYFFRGCFNILWCSLRYPLLTTYYDRTGKVIGHYTKTELAEIGKEFECPTCGQTDWVKMQRTRKNSSITK